MAYETHSHHQQPLEKTITDRTALNSDHYHNGAMSDQIPIKVTPQDGGFAGGGQLGRQISIQLTQEQFEKLYLQPGGFGASRQEDLTKRFANPTVLGLAVFVLSLTPASGYFMGWMGTDTTSLIALSPSFLLLTGIGLWTAGILEWILGNTFPFVVFTSFSGLYFSLGYLVQPTNGIALALGASSVVYNNGLALWFIYWAIITFVYFIISLRTNVFFVVLFFTLDIFFCLTAAGYDRVSRGDLEKAGNLFKAAGAFVFVTCLCGWYLFIALMMASNNFPVGLPLGDLSHFLETPREKRKRDETLNAVNAGH